MLHAEEIPEEENNLGPQERLIHVYHYTIDASQIQMQVKNFGEPFFLIIHQGETFGQVKLRIQQKLQVPGEEFSKWKFAFSSLGRAKYLQDSDVVSSCFEGRDIYGAWEQHLGLEHSEGSWERTYPTNQQEAAELNGLDSDNAEDLKVAQAETNGAGPTLGDRSLLPNYPTAGQHFQQGEHYQGILDEQYEDIGGFSILKTQAPLYRQIWLRYGHIATNQVMKNLYGTQVALVTDIVASIMDMHNCCFAEVSYEKIELWENKLSMAEKLEWKKAQENVWSLESKIRLLHKKKLMCSEKGRSLLLQGLL